VTLDFEIQEAVTFRDGAASAFADLRPVLAARDSRATDRLGAALDELGVALAEAARRDAVAAPEDVRATTDEALGRIDALYPSEWKEAAETADFDVIAATLDRLQAAAAAGDWKRAEQARLEAYGVFELGPEQRLRGLAPSLFQEVEGYFWYGAEGFDGLVQLLGRHAPDEEIASTRAALDDALARSEQQIGSGSQSELSVVTNSAIIVFREGLEAVLILAALMASLVGRQRHFRRPMFAGVGLALVASAVTWVVAQTVLTSLAVYGEKLEAIVSLVAIGVLLLILNWFYHRVYWQENLQGLHHKKRRVLAGAGLSLAAAQIVGLVLLGFSSVYREGFETVLFLQAMTLEAGALTVLEGVALGLAAVVAVFVLVIALERKLPHRKMLIATGVLITWVLVVMVGTTVQTMQKVGWIAVTPIEGLELPYWAGLWLGVFPTWQGIGAQIAAATFVLGSYFAAEALRKRKRARLIASAGTLAAGAEPGSAPSDARLRDRAPAARTGEPVATVDPELVLHRS
jgi:high-affinity iron transporter